MPVGSTCQKSPLTRIPLRGLVRAVYKKMGKAIADYGMLAHNDKLLVAVTGGADSLALVTLLAMRRARIPIDFEITACFVRAPFIRVDEQIVRRYLGENGIACIVREMPLQEEGVDCFWCSWNRRRVLFEAAHESGCNKLVLGHHLDDVAETILMNLFFFGEVSAMKPDIAMFGDRFRLIRPLCYLDKEAIAQFAEKLELPVTGYRCAHGKDTRRELVKKVIRTVEEDCSYAKKNIFRALRKIRSDYLT